VCVCVCLVVLFVSGVEHHWKHFEKTI